MKKILLVIAILILVTGVCFGANSRTSVNTSAARYEEASVDTDPGANGYGCLPVNIEKKKGAFSSTESMWFYIKSITGATVTLQWKFGTDSDFADADGVWTDYEDYTAVTVLEIKDDSTGRYWRAIVKDDAQGTSSVFGINW